MAVSYDKVRDLMRDSTKAFARGIMPDKFNIPFSPNIHDKIFALLDDPAIKRKAVAAPRGTGKTTTLAAYCAKKIGFQQKKNIIYISHTHNFAVKRTEAIKRIITTNPLFKALFGDVQGSKWAQDEWTTSTGITIIPKGSDQQVRGELSIDNVRPDLIICDDLEDDQRMKSEDYRKELSGWFYSSVMNMIDRSVDDWEIIVLGTILHEDALLAKLLEDPYWTSTRLELFDDNLNSLWPDQTTDQEIKEMYEAYRAMGKLPELYMELRNMVVTPDQSFKSSYFKYYEETELDLNNSYDAETMVLVDPAKTAELQSDFSAVVGVAINSMKHALYVRDIVNERLYPDQLYEKVFQMAERLNARIIGLEVTGLNEFIRQPFHNYMLQRGGKLFQVEDLKARGRHKEDRIAALIPYYRLGTVFHNKAVSAPLEAQLLSFPRSKHDDVMDCLAYAIELMEKGQRYFRHHQEVQSKKQIEEEYAKLYNEPALEWSRI